MANVSAIHNVCEAVVRLLHQAWQSNPFPIDPLNTTTPPLASMAFEVYQTSSFDSPMENGVSLFLYRVNINSTQRSIPAQPDPITGRQRHPQLPLDLHFILTPWAKHISTEQRLLGWMMRVLEDHPRLPPSLLNAAGDAGFDANEMVEIAAGTMTTDEMFHIWEVLPGDFRISVPYVARVVRIDSDMPMGGGIVLTRDLRYGEIAVDDESEEGGG